MVAETECDRTARPPARSAYQSPPRRQGPTLAGLLRDLLDQFSQLFRQELRLARAEMAEKANKVTNNAISIGIGAAVAFLGAIALIAAACAGLAAGMVSGGMDLAVAAWLSPLIVGGLLAIVGWVLILKGVSTLKDMSVTPDKTTDSLKETARWMQNKVS